MSLWWTRRDLCCVWTRPVDEGTTEIVRSDYRDARERRIATARSPIHRRELYQIGERFYNPTTWRWTGGVSIT